MDELKMTGNCLKGSRGLLSFDKGFEDSEWGRLTKEVFTHVSTMGLHNPRDLTVTSRFSVSLRQHESRNHLSIISLHSPFWTPKYGLEISKYAPFGPR